MKSLQLAGDDLSLLLSACLIAEQQFQCATKHTAQWQMPELAEAHKQEYIRFMEIREKIEKRIATNNHQTVGQAIDNAKELGSECVVLKVGEDEYPYKVVLKLRQTEKQIEDEHKGKSICVVTKRGNVLYN